MKFILKAKVFTTNQNKGETIMDIHTVEHFQNRINLLKPRGEVQNSKLIKKLERQIRSLQNEKQ